MRRTLGYALSAVTGYTFALHVHTADLHWRWYSGGPATASDDPLALIALVVVTGLCGWVVYQVTPARRRQR